MLRDAPVVSRGVAMSGPAGRAQALPLATVKRYHVTTFGCQMNEHDSERMKGMLESLGYAEAAEPRGRRSDPLQHLLDP